jgi:Glycosyltransferase family 87
VPRLAFAGLGLATAAATLATVLTSAPWPERLPLHLALFLAAGALWAATIALLPRLAPRPRDRAVLVAIALLLRLPAWAAGPAHSDDVYRYAWDGRVTLAGINPYRYAPAAPELAHLREGHPIALPEWERGPARPTARSGPLWSRVNNADLPTIYPPVAQIAFALAALIPLPPPYGAKILLAACDLGLLLLLLRLLARRGGDLRQAVAWAWSPLVAIELGQNAHLEALPLLGLVGALAAWERGRRALAGALLGLATGAKLFTAPLALALRSPRAWLAMALALALTALPFLGAGRAIAGSTGEFARRWRGNDGLYALIQAATDRATCRALGAPSIEREGPKCTKPLDLWPNQRLAELISGRTYRAAVYPDELSSFIARALAGLLFLALCALVLLRRPPPLAAAEWILGGLLLLTPTLHPWYATWMLPLVTLNRRPAWIALAALVPLGYAPMAAWLAGGPWRDPIWSRALVHLPCWTLLLAGIARTRARWLTLRLPGIQS